MNLTEEGELNRPKVSELVFHDKAALKALESILHKIVWENAEQFLQEQKQLGKAVFSRNPPNRRRRRRRGCRAHGEVGESWRTAERSGTAGETG